MNTQLPEEASLTHEHVHAPWLGPRRADGNILIGPHPAFVQAWVMGIPVTRADEGGYRLRLASTEDGVKLKPVLHSNGPWTTVMLTPPDDEAEGYLMLVLSDWSPRREWNMGFSLPLTGSLPMGTAQRLLDAMAEQGRLDELDRSFVAKAGLNITPSPSFVHSAPTSAAVGELCFAFGSCQFPSGVMDGLPSGRSLERLSQRIRKPTPSCPPIQAVFLLGDQIYADASYGILDPGLRADDGLASMYEAWLATPALQDILRQVPIHTLPDDHEIKDNWEPPGNAQDNKRLKAFRTFQRASSAPLPFWGAMVLNGFDAFLLDTRTEREVRVWGGVPTPLAPASAPHMINAAQRTAFANWLNTTSQDRPRFVFSSVWPLPRPRSAEALADSWAGFPASLQWLLEQLVDQDRGRICILCGDAHLAGHTRLHLKRDDQQSQTTAQVDILHAPALYAPFPFANGRPHEFIRKETLQWTRGGTSYQCEVQSDLRGAVGDGFVEVCLPSDGSPLTANFHTDEPFSIQIP